MSQVGTIREIEAETLREIGASMAVSNYRRAFELADAALARGGLHPAFFNVRGRVLESEGRYGEALEEYGQALSLAPEDPVILNAIGLCLLKLERFREAIDRFDAALAIDPLAAQVHYRKGWTHAMLGEHEVAKRAHEQALALQPEFPDALASLATIAVRNEDMGAARDFAERALKLDPRQPTALTALAQIELAGRSFPQAEKKLRSVLADPSLSPYARAVVRGLLGDALDGQDRIAEAFAAYTAGNEHFRRRHAAGFAGDRRAVEAERTLILHFAEIPPECWATPPADDAREDAPAQHAFLVGFTSSGTTLLEQALASHPGVVTLEEREILGDVAQRFLIEETGMHRVSVLEREEAVRIEDLYWRRVRENGLDATGKVFVDKLPLNLIKLPLIAKVFPRAKILFALRDPRDIVLSCFRRHFDINAAMFELLRLDDAARFYDATMRLMELYCDRLPLAVHRLRYEDLIEDFDAQTRALCNFLGLAWSDEMRRFDERARNQPLRSPSAPQVRRKLYREAMGQWRRYGDQMGPVLPILAPWVERYGYPPD